MLSFIRGFQGASGVAFHLFLNLYQIVVMRKWLGGWARRLKGWGEKESFFIPFPHSLFLLLIFNTHLQFYSLSSEERVTSLKTSAWEATIQWIASFITIYWLGNDLINLLLSNVPQDYWLASWICKGATERGCKHMFTYMPEAWLYALASAGMHCILWWYNCVNSSIIS